MFFSKDEDDFLKGLDQPENDRKYAKNLLEKCFTESYFFAKSSEGCSVATTLKAIESSNLYFVAKGNLQSVHLCVVCSLYLKKKQLFILEMYKNRVIKDGTGDIQNRLKIFDNVIYKKTDYMFRHRLSKSTSK